MDLAAIVATVMLAVLIGFVGMVLVATWRQLNDESQAAAERRDP
jgi:hypothetical protein